MVGSGEALREWNPEWMCAVDTDRDMPQTPKPRGSGQVFPGKAQKDGKAFLGVSMWILMVCAENVRRSFLQPDIRSPPKPVNASAEIS